MKKRVVVALGHRALGTTLPEQKTAVKHTAKCIADLIEEGYQVAITHSNAPQLGMIHTAMNEFAKAHKDYTPAPMSVCSAMSQGYIGYDLQNGIREELLNRGIYRTVSTVLTQVIVDPYDEAFYTPTKVLGRYMNAQEANEERKKGNYVIEEPGKGFRRVVSAPNPVKIVELDAVKALLDANQVVIAAGGGGIPVLVPSSKKILQPESLQRELTLKCSSSLQMSKKSALISDRKMKNRWERSQQNRLRHIWRKDISEFTICFLNSVLLLIS